MTLEFSASSEHEFSGRVAILGDEGDAVWLHLTEAGTDEIAGSCWLFNRVPALPAEELDAQTIAGDQAAGPPPAVREVIDDAALIDGPLGGRVRFAWSVDGEAVAAWVDGALAGFITAGDAQGYSAHLTVDCAWGHPVDPALHDQLFGS